MGGYGSGRWHGHRRKRTVEECLRLDASRLARDGVFFSPWSGTISWARQEKTSTVGYSLESVGTGGLVFRLQYTRFLGEDKHDVDVPILLQTTRPHFGGERWWFTCPLMVGGKACRRRVGKLYLPSHSVTFGCRHCHQLTYRRCQVSGDPSEVWRLRMQRIQRKLGPNGDKPKGMHWETYERLSAALDEAYRSRSAVLDARLFGLLKRFERLGGTS